MSLTTGKKNGLALVGACGLVTGLSSAALAGAPKVLDHVPADNGFTLVIPNLQSALSDLSAAGQKFRPMLPDDANAVLVQLQFAQIFLLQPGVDATGSAAVMVELGEGGIEAGDYSAMAILPVSDWDAFTQSPILAEIQPEIDGDVMKIDADGVPIVARNLGGFVLVGADEESVMAFAGDAGHLAGHEEMIGAAGGALAESNDVMLIANVDAFQEAGAAAMADFKQQAAFMGAMAGGGDAVGPGIEVLGQVVDNFFRDGETGLLGLDFSADGVAIDLAANFDAGTELAGFFDSGSDSSGLVSALPEMPFLFAWAGDFSGDGIKKILGNLAEMGGAAGDGLGGLAGKGSGTSGLLGPTNPFAGGGLLSNMVTYTKGVDAAFIRGEMVSQAEVEGSGISVEISEGAAEVEGVSVDRYQITTEPAEADGQFGMMVDPAMITQMLFGGSGGPGGYIAEANGGVYSTGSANNELIGSAIKAGEGNSLTDGAMLGSVANRLPKGRAFEAYIGVDQILNTAGPIAGMMGGPEIPRAEAMAPIGLGLSPVRDGVVIRAFLPADVLLFLGELAPAAAQMAPGMGGGDPEF